MNTKLRLLIFLIFFGSFYFSCQKTEIEPSNYFEAEINNENESFKSIDVSISKGITIITANELNKFQEKSVIITINDDDVGNYKQTFDYKTGVSISQCGLTYRIEPNSKSNSPIFFTSFEGSVNISEIDRRKKQISGSYFFKLNTIPDVETPYIFKGKFIKLAY